MRSNLIACCDPVSPDEDWRKLAKHDIFDLCSRPYHIDHFVESERLSRHGSIHCHCCAEDKGPAPPEQQFRNATVLILDDEGPIRDQPFQPSTIMPSNESPLREKWPESSNGNETLAVGLGLDLNRVQRKRSTNMLTVTIHHPDGVSMRFSESLMRFLADPGNQHRPFLLGDWIGSLDDETLSHLTTLSDQAAVDLDALGQQIQDLLLVVVTAVAAEKQALEVPLSPELLGDYFETLCLATRLERFRRAGWLILHSPLSIDGHQDAAITLTERGLEEGFLRSDSKRYWH